MNIFDRFADTTALESLIRQLAVRNLTLHPEQRTSALDQTFAKYLRAPEGQPRFIIPNALDAETAIRFDPGNTEDLADPSQVFVAVERDFAQALEDTLVVLPRIRTPMSNAQARADRERVQALRTLLDDNAGAFKIEGVLDQDSDRPREVNDCYVLFDPVLRSRVVGERDEIALRDQHRMDNRATAHAKAQPIHHHGAMALSTLQISANLNELRAVSQGRREHANEPMGLKGSVAYFDRLFGSQPRRGQLTEADLIQLANATEWRVARRLAGAARAEVSLGDRRSQIGRLHHEFQANLAHRRQALRSQLADPTLAPETAAELQAQEARLDTLALREQKAFTARDAFEAMVGNANTNRDEGRTYARTQRRLDLLSERGAEQARRLLGQPDRRGVFDRTRQILDAIREQREAIDGAEIPAVEHYLYEAYFREVGIALHDAQDSTDRVFKTKSLESIDTLAVDVAKTVVSFDYLSLKQSLRPNAERVVLDLVTRGDNASDESRQAFRDALDLRVSTHALQALAEHPSELDRYTKGLRESLEVLLIARRFGNERLLNAIEKASEHADRLLASGKRDSARPPFFDNARLGAMTADLQPLSADANAAARAEASFAPPRAPIQLAVNSSDLVAALTEYAPLAPYRDVVKNVARALTASPDERRAMIMRDATLEAPLAILQAAAIRAVDRDAFPLPAALTAALPNGLTPEQLAPLPNALRGEALSELQRRVGIVPTAGEGQLVTHVDGKIVGLSVVAALPDANRIFVTRVTPDSRITGFDQPGLLNLRFEDGLADIVPLGGLLATVQSPNGERTVIPLHAVHSFKDGDDARATGRFERNPTRALLEAMVDGRPVSFDTNRDAFGITAVIQGQARDRSRSPQDREQAQELLVDGEALETLTLPTQRPRGVSSRWSQPRATKAVLSFDPASIEGAFIHAHDGSHSHRVPLSALSAEARQAVSSGAHYRDIFQIEPQLFTPALRYRPAPTFTHSIDHGAFLIAELRHAAGTRQVTLIPADMPVSIPESRHADLMYRTESLGYYKMSDGRGGVTVVEYAPHGREISSVARFSQSGDSDVMDEAAQEENRLSGLGRRRDQLPEQFALPTSGRFISDRGRLAILPNDDAREGLNEIPAVPTVLVGIEQVSKQRRTREGELLSQVGDHLTVAVVNGEDHLGNPNVKTRNMSTSRLARYEPDGRTWQIYGESDDSDKLFLIDPKAVGHKVVLQIDRSELDDESVAREFVPGQHCTLSATPDHHLRVHVADDRRAIGLTR